MFDKRTTMKQHQLTDTVVMISPDQFGFNPETAVTNVFQHNLTEEGLSEQIIRDTALEEFQQMVTVLKEHQINVLVLPSRKDVVTPDAVFPNNWFSHHENNLLILYPMLTPNRRVERQPKALTALLASAGIPHPTVKDLANDEHKGNILEGTGSLVLDREHQVAFAMGSPRTTKAEFEKWCKEMDYQGIFFHAYDAKRFPIYHTNVVMSIGREYVVICLDSISDTNEKEKVIQTLKTLNKEIIPISIEQLKSFCGNILQALSTKGEVIIIMSDSAWEAFTPQQQKILHKYGEIIPVHIPTIEKVSGGSARCMLAEIFSVE